MFLLSSTSGLDGGDEGANVHSSELALGTIAPDAHDLDSLGCGCGEWSLSVTSTTWSSVTWTILSDYLAGSFSLVVCLVALLTAIKD